MRSPRTTVEFGTASLRAKRSNPGSFSGGSLDCVASLAMTCGDISILSRIPIGQVAASSQRVSARAVLISSRSQTESAGKAGRWPHPWPACRKKAGGSHHRFSRNVPALPARWAYGLYVLSPVNGLSCHRRPCDAEHRHELSASVAAPGPYDFAVHHPASRLAQSARPDNGHRIPLPRIVTTRTPLVDEAGRRR